MVLRLAPGERVEVSIFYRARDDFAETVGLARRVTDKALFKEWLEEKGYGTLVVPTLGFYESVDELRDLVLAKDTILKPTHLSGTVIVIRDSRKLTSAETARAKK